MASLKCYHMIWMMMDSADLGEPVSRPRCYFLLLRRDACVSSDIHELAKFCELCLQAAKAPVSAHVAARMLSSSHPLVRAYLNQAQEKQKRSSGRRVGEKWMSKHSQYKQMIGVPGFRGIGGRSIGRFFCGGEIGENPVQCAVFNRKSLHNVVFLAKN